MNSRALTLRHQTRLAVQVIIEDDTGTLAFSMSVITSLFARLRQVGQLGSTINRELALLLTDTKSAFDFTTKVLAIGFNSLAFGLGVIL